MDPVQPDTKRPRIAPPQGVPLPQIQTTSANPSQLPPPPHPHHLSHPQQHHQHQLHHPPPHPHPSSSLPPPPPPGPSAYPPYPPRSHEPQSAPPALPTAAPPHLRHEADRRHHEQEPYAPMHDQYRQPLPPSPAHGHYPPQTFHPGREAPVKREAPSYEDQSRRSSSAGHALESGPMQPVPTHPHQPPPYADNQPRHMNYDHGPGSVPPTPGGYRAPAHPPPTPISQHYEPPGYNSGAAEPYYSVYSSIQAKRKNTRASQACDQCRQLKAKCDETKPCKTCRDKNLECRYRDPIPKATDKAQADILEGLARLENILHNQATEMTEVNGRLIKLESLYRSAGEVAVKHDPAGDDDHKATTRSPQTISNTTSEQYSLSETSREQAASATETAPSDTTMQPVLPPNHFGPGEPGQTEPEDQVESEPGHPVPPGQEAIPHNHTTLAGLLLDWPGIRQLTRHHLAACYNGPPEQFPIMVEQNRGALILYGRGEDSPLTLPPRDIPDHGTLDPQDDNSEMASPSPAPDYGQLGGLSPPDLVEFKGGPLTTDGNPDFSEQKIWTYVESFKENILNMHPIIQPRVLDNWVKQFLESMVPTQTRSSKYSVRTSFAVGNAESTGMKRKRSPAPDGSETPSTPQPTKPGMPNRSVHSALILTVLALGKVCLSRDRIPDALHNVPDPLPHGSPRNAVPASPAQSSPPNMGAHASHSGYPSPNEMATPSRRASMQTSNPSNTRNLGLKKNYDVIPGLEYFALATDILGNHMGAFNNMKNVYANIFASLYYGQLERPMQSYAHINGASNKLLVILRPSMMKLKAMKASGKLPQETKYNQLCLAFWTCLQLESDIIAELSLPPSGLLSYEDDMPDPSMNLLDGVSDRISDSYLAQLYLRRHLNWIHRTFYAPSVNNKEVYGNGGYPSKDSTGEKQPSFLEAKAIADGIEALNWVSYRFKFDQNDPPAENILAARLRAKFWGAMMITYRPFIKQILEFSEAMVQNPDNPALHDDTEFRSGMNVPRITRNARHKEDIKPIIIECAAKAIKALIESTRSFHGLGPQRPIITNVYGTAHAQWGNLLVLTACWKDPILHQHVEERVLRDLYTKTIRFLSKSCTATSSLKVDLQILQGMYDEIWGKWDPAAGSSFSSHSSVPTPMAAPPMVPH